MSHNNNMNQPACHLKPPTSVIGLEQPIAIPKDCQSWSGTTELRVVITIAGSNILREQTMNHVVGYTVVNDGSPDCYKLHWALLNRLAYGEQSLGFHFHSSNTGSWLGKATDGMCAIGPFLVTKGKIPNPYDLMRYYREGGGLRDRAHSSALCCGVEELIYWLPQFVKLEPGMVLYMGAMGRDGIQLNQSADLDRGYFIEAEIEGIGIPRNPVIFLNQHAINAANYSIHPVPLVREMLAKEEIYLSKTEDWQIRNAHSFWALVANYEKAEQTQRIPPRPYPLAYETPVSALCPSGSTVTSTRSYNHWYV
ncbi:MAG: fumarylacetoacetate hydrolase family protein [Anaerolineae bacterium]